MTSPTEHAARIREYVGQLAVCWDSEKPAILASIEVDIAALEAQAVRITEPRIVEVWGHDELLAQLEFVQAQLVAAQQALRAIEALDDEEDPGFDPSPDYWAGVSTAARIAREALAGVDVPPQEASESSVTNRAGGSLTSPVAQEPSE